jgi:hypothetical protein
MVGVERQCVLGESRRLLKKVDRAPYDFEV